MKKKLNKYFLPAVLFLFAAIAAFLFIMPTILTITNSFMTEKEISAYYGASFTLSPFCFRMAVSSA